MDINMIRKEDITIDKLISRFIKYTETNVANNVPNDEKVVSLAQFKETEKNKNEADEYADFIALNTGDAIFDIIVSKVRMATLVDISDPESNVSFDDTFAIFKAAVSYAEKIYKEEDKNIYEMPLFTVVDAITSITASTIVESHFTNVEAPTNQ